jgi:hypothetical protein
MPAARSLTRNGQRSGDGNADISRFSVSVTFDSLFPCTLSRVSNSSPPPVQFHHPATFHNRGAAVPFTTPLLVGARVRQAKPAGVDVLVLNPSGGRGVYIVQWPGVRALCAPSVHDSVLFQGIVQLKQIDPAAVRSVALNVASGGYAGRDAKDAAEAARGRDKVDRMLTDFLVVAALVEQVEPTGGRMTRIAERTPDFDRRADRALRLIAPSLGCPAGHILNGLAALGAAFTPVGATANQTARIPRMIILLKETRVELSRWLATNPAGDIASLGKAVSDAMDATAGYADEVLAGVRTTLADPMALLQRWLIDPDDPLNLATRCDWVLDGWERICLLWKLADSLASRRAALMEMAQLLPVQPSEINNWISKAVPQVAMDDGGRVVGGNDARRSGGAAFALIQRNELLRVMSW